MYAAHKAALNSGLTQSMALELAPFNIRVNAVLPAVVDTDMTAQIVEAMGDEHPLGRVGRPEEIAAVVLQLLSNQWQTGSLVTVDGGWLVRP
ncbi:MAG: SDR family oxidoreductase [Polyangiales bacterium]